MGEQPGRCARCGGPTVGRHARWAERPDAKLVKVCFGCHEDLRRGAAWMKKGMTRDA